MDYMPEAFDPPSLDLMCEVRRVFDPDARANPGKVFPLRTCREWRQGGVE
jgi:glycolate oxidase